MGFSVHKGVHCADAAGALQVLQPLDSLLSAASRIQGAHNPDGQTLNDIAWAFDSPQIPCHCQRQEENVFPLPPAFQSPVIASQQQPVTGPGFWATWFPERKAKQNRNGVWVSAYSIWHIGGTWQEWSRKYNLVIASDVSQQTPTTAVDFMFNQLSEQWRRENIVGQSVGNYQYKGKTGQVCLLELTNLRPVPFSLFSEADFKILNKGSN